MDRRRTDFMKVLLMHAPSRAKISKDDRCQVDLRGFTIEIPRPPINLLYLGAVSKEMGHETTIIDAPSEQISQEQCVELLSKFDYAASSLSPQTLDEDVSILKYAKDSGAKTIAFGYASSINDVELLKKYPFIDVAIRGEPEITFKEILGGMPTKEIKGVAFRVDGRIIRNEDREFIDDLDSLPLPARELIRNELYKNPITGKTFTTVQASRGCNFRCTFCLSRVMNGSKARYRSVENVIKELKSCVADFGITDFFFRGDTFTVDNEWVREMCRKIVEEGLKITWYCNSRVDTIDKKTLEAMKKAGCKLIAFGIESGNEEILKHVKKGITKQEALNSIRAAREAGILTWAFYILGLPGDTEQTIRETIRFSKEVDSDFVEYHRFMPFPGTEAYEQGQCKVAQETLIKMINDAYTSYYFRPKIILRQANNFFSNLNSISGFARTCRTGVTVTKRLLARYV